MFKSHDSKMFRLARLASLSSPHEKAMIGAVISRKKEVLSIGVNGLKSHPTQKHYNQFRFQDDTAEHLLHAEIDAIVKLPYVPYGCSIYVYRELRNGTPGMSRPCAGCMRALKDFQIKRIFYSTEEGTAYEELT